MVPHIVRKLALSAGSLVLVFGSAELICRAAGLGPAPGSFRWAGNDKVGYLPMPDQDTSFGPGNPETGRPHVPVHVNRYAQRGPDYPLEKQPGEWRLAVVGDSLTFGQDVADADCYPAQLERMLRTQDSAGRLTRVVNAGVNGWSAWNYAQWTRHYLADFDVDLLVVGVFLGNDMVPAAEGAGVIPIPLHSVLRDSALYHWMLTLYREFLWKRIESRRRGKSMSELDELIDQYKGISESDLSLEEKHVLWEQNALPQLLRARDAAREQGVPTIVLLIPTMAQVFGRSKDDAHEFLKSELEARGVVVATCLEDLRAIGREGYLAWDEGHLSVEGNRVVAEALARQLPQP